MLTVNPPWELLNEPNTFRRMTHLETLFTEVARVGMAAGRSAGAQEVELAAALYAQSLFIFNQLGPDAANHIRNLAIGYVQQLTATPSGAN